MPSTTAAPTFTTHCFSVPSKTFLLGEYAVLAQQPAIIINTLPRFSLLLSQLADKDTPCEYVNVSTDCVTQQLRDLIDQHCLGYRLSFIDPHHTTGGFGASSAQYALLWAAYCHMTQHTMQPAACLTQYLNHSEVMGHSPSGADLIAQLHGQISMVNPQHKQCETLTWPWPDVQCVLLRTQHKVATHQHIATLTTFPHQQLGELSMAGINAIKQQQQRDLIDIINATATCLQQAQLTDHNTVSLLAQLADCPFVLAAKGCGALGADVILAIVPTNDIALLQTWIHRLPVTYVSDTQHLSDGLSIEIMHPSAQTIDGLSVEHNQQADRGSTA